MVYNSFTPMMNIQKHIGEMVTDTKLKKTVIIVSQKNGIVKVIDTDSKEIYTQVQGWLSKLEQEDI